MVATGQDMNDQGKNILQGQGKLRKFYFESGKIKVFERSQENEKFQEYICTFYGHESCWLGTILLITACEIEQQADIGFSRKSILFLHVICWKHK